MICLFTDYEVDTKHLFVPGLVLGAKDIWLYLWETDALGEIALKGYSNMVLL